MNHIRIVTAAGLFDGHDVSINIMRRILQSKGAEVIHLGHNRSAWEVAKAAIEEDVHAVAISSYQGGHNEYFPYVRKLLDENGGQHIKIFGGGGGVITPKEIAVLEKKGVEKIYSPEDGMKLGLDGIIGDIIKRCQFETFTTADIKSIQESKNPTPVQIARVVSFIENQGKLPFDLEEKKTPVLGITGTGGAGKSSLIDELFLRFNLYCPKLRVALVCVDPTKKKTKGALLGDRIRLGSVTSNQFYMRSLASRSSGNELSPYLHLVIKYLKSLSFDLIVVETSGIGQASDEITKISNLCYYVMTPEYGAQTQLEKIEMLDMADFIVLNKFERARAEDALRDVRKQYRRNHGLFQSAKELPDDQLPIYGTIASQFNDEGVNSLFYDTLTKLNFETDSFSDLRKNKSPKAKSSIISPQRSSYLSEISQTVREYHKTTEKNARYLRHYQALKISRELLGPNKEVEQCFETSKSKIDENIFQEIENFDQHTKNIQSGMIKYSVRGREFQVESKYESLSHSLISKVAYPKSNDLETKYRFIRKEGLPGFFPYVAGIFPVKRSDEDPKRQFAGEGGPKRTNKRFHYLSKDDQSKRLSTAFDSVTLYGEDPDKRPDIYGKIGESGVSICTLDDMEDLFSGFDLTSQQTSVSMTINGPAPIILALFMNTAFRQTLKGNDYWDKEKRLEIMRQVRGTVQADILKEDQAQNTCIFSLEFALKMMGDVQEFFSKNHIKNYYTVSISGYHIAEAGANPITQLALTLSNGFTYIEYYLSRGLHIDDICPNLSFFFSNGLDPEYSVIGRVARRIWAITLQNKYGANTKSQKLKYHIQTSGRSLHAQEMDFNDIRTTLQAFLALSDNCNSLHTNAYDEAITTPTKESVRRAMAIQMIINREFGLNKTDNPLQGSFLIDELTDLVEEQVLREFEMISNRGGVLGAMESMYQRSKIQDESHYYEMLKDSGELPIIGVNTYISPDVSGQLVQEIELTRASEEEKNDQIKRLNQFKSTNKTNSQNALNKLKNVALNGGNIFEELLDTVNYCSLGEIVALLYTVGGRYRRNT